MKKGQYDEFYLKQKENLKLNGLFSIYGYYDLHFRRIFAMINMCLTEYQTKLFRQSFVLGFVVGISTACALFITCIIFVLWII